jgi:hypothetical protein
MTSDEAEAGSVGAWPANEVCLSWRYLKSSKSFERSKYIVTDYRDDEIFYLLSQMGS